MYPTPNSAIAGKLADAELARQVAAGDSNAFRLLLRRYNRTLYGVARNVLKDETEAEDAVQDAYLLAYRAMGKFRGEAKLSTWLARIVINEAIARLRKRRRMAEIVRPDSAESDNGAEEPNINVSTSEQPEHAAQRAQTRRLLEGKIEELPQSFRTVFMMRAVEELSVEETAAALDIPEATVRTRYFRAKSLLRTALSKEADFAYVGVLTPGSAATASSLA